MLFSWHHRYGRTHQYVRSDLKDFIQISLQVRIDSLSSVQHIPSATLFNEKHHDNLSYHQGALKQDFGASWRHQTTTKRARKQVWQNTTSNSTWNPSLVPERKSRKYSIHS